METTGHFDQSVRKSIESSIAVKELLLKDAGLVATVGQVAEMLIEAFGVENKVILFGNGGSAADAQHIAAEFVGRFAFDRPALPALALSVNSSCVTAIGNDYGFEQVFSRQLEALARRGDVAIGISTSGRSENVVSGMATAKRLGLHTVALTGSSRGPLSEIVEYCLCVPSNETPRIQECHILLGHIIAELAERTIFHKESSLSRTATR